MTFDLTEVARQHRVRHVKLDLETFDLRETLTVTDVLDMARVLGVAPDKLAIQLAPDGRIGERAALDVTLALAWIIGRKAEPGLEWETVQATWQLEVPEVGTRNPTRARRRRAAKPSAQRS